MPHTHIDPGIFPFKVLVVYNVDFEGWKKESKKFSPGFQKAMSDKQIKGFFKSAKGFYLYRRFKNFGPEDNDSWVHAIFLPDKFERKNYEIGIISHEVTHLCQGYFEDIRLSRNEEQECEAYFHGFMVEKILDFIDQTDKAAEEKELKDKEKLKKYRAKKMKDSDVIESLKCI